MSPTAIERARRGTNPKPASFAQRRYIAYLAKKAGIETPEVAWSWQANIAIERLRQRLRQPSLWS